MRKRILLVLAAIIAVTASLAAYYRSSAQQSVSYATAPVTRGTIVQSVAATGTLQAVTTVQVGSQVSGTIKALRADFNSEVKKGEVIAELDSSLFQTQVEQARASLVRLQADVERARVDVADTQTKLKRADELWARQLISRADLDTAQTAARQAEAAVKSAQAQVTQAQAVLNQNQVSLDHTIIRAPIDGIVISRNVDVGQTVASSLQAPTLFVIANVIAPYPTVQKRLLGVQHITGILVSGENDSPLAAISTQIAELLRERHHIQPGVDDDFAVHTQEEMASVLTSTTQTMTWLLAGIAAVSLLVGGIGIMNIMLVSVTERTREIGLRLSIGARDIDVLTQFLVEATVLSVAGGILGILVGVGFAMGVSRFAHWATDVTMPSVVLSFAVAAGTGVFFGYYPARKAASLDPIDALRYE